MKFFISLIFVLVLCQASGQYTLDKVPPELMKDADALILESSGILTILREDRASFKVRKVIAILNSDGQKFATEELWYDKLRKVQGFSGEAYTISGKSIKTLKKSEIEDYSGISGFSIYEDNRVQVGDLRQNRLPYIVSFEYEIIYNQTYLLPSWYLLPDDEVGAVRSTFRIDAPDKFFPQYKVLNLEDAGTVSSNEGITSVKFIYDNIPPIKFESRQPRDILPAILVSPKNFLVSGYQGSFENWKSFGEFQRTLNEGLDDLPLETAEKMRFLTKDIQDPKEKIRTVYEYVQNNTRYVSIQLGIGGWQPFANSVVDETGYGDCKALSFYTKSLLKAIDIESNYTIVYAGNNPYDVDPDFTSSRFNHVFLSVPNKGDTVWLECTSQTNPFGYLGKFTSDRDVVLITDEGGKIVRTPKYPAEINTQETTGLISFSEEMVADIELNVRYQGLQYSNLNIPETVSLSSDKQKEWVQKNIEVPSVQILDYKFSLDKKAIPESQVELKLSSDRLASSLGKRQFIYLNQFNRVTYVPDKNEDRQFDISIRYGYNDRDSILFELPPNYRVEYLPEPVNVVTEFGHYKMSIEQTEKGLFYRRDVLWKDGLFDKGKYNDYRAFWSAIVKGDKIKIALIDKT